MKKSKKFVLAGLVLLAAITGLLALAGCKDAAGGGGSEYQFPAGVKVLTGHQGTASPTSFPPVEGAVYVEFGEWPQTIKVDGVTVDKTMAGETRGGLIYYKGSDGAWYVEAEENAYGMNYKYSDGTPV